MCRWLAVSRAGYYAWASRPEAARTILDRALVVEIKAIHAATRRAYGSPRMHAELRARGHEVGRHKVARLMRLNGIRAKRKRAFCRTTDSDHGFKPAANVLERQFRPNKPNAVWASDITYIPTGEGWLYLAVVLDLYSRRVIGWGMGPRLDRQLALSALKMAAAARPTAGVLHHSDRGVQYASGDYQAALTEVATIVPKEQQTDPRGPRCGHQCPDHAHTCDRDPGHGLPHRDVQQKGTETCSWDDEPDPADPHQIAVEVMLHHAREINDIRDFLPDHLKEIGLVLGEAKFEELLDTVVDLAETADITIGWTKES